MLRAVYVQVLGLNCVCLHSASPLACCPLESYMVFQLLTLPVRQIP